MFKIDRISNRIEVLKEESFKNLGFREREHIQEWICNTPNCLGEELLIIQKEFDGFNDTRERLDLLALDKQGNIVVIENKLDDSGRDVTWQALKYASYCSTLTKEQIKEIYQHYLDKTSSGLNSEDKLSEFFGGIDYDDLILNQLTQRILLIAANFRKEVTSTVIWLINHQIRLQCFKITPYSMGNELLLNVEQILPVQEAAELSIKMSNKLQENIESQETLKARHHIRLKFWKQFIEESNKINTIFQNSNPSKDNWISSGLGMTGVSIEAKISQKSVRVEIYINRGNKEENERIFEILSSRKEQIENQINLPKELVWDKGIDKVTSVIKYETNEYNVFSPEEWKEINSFLIYGFEQMEKVFKKEIAIIKNKV